MKEVDVVKERLVQLRENLENNGIHFNWTPGEQYSNLICPKVHLFYYRRDFFFYE